MLKITTDSDGVIVKVEERMSNIREVTRISNFKNVSSHKNAVLQQLLGAEGICKALYYDSKQFLDQPPVSEPEMLIHSRIFPYYTWQEPPAEPKSMISFVMNDFEKINNRFNQGKLEFYVSVHKELVETDYDLLRSDYLVNEIDQCINKQRIGFGRAEFSKMRQLPVKSDFITHRLIYKFTENG